MSVPQPNGPAFGEADLSNCEREEIAFPGSIQPHGVLLVAREPDLEVVQASVNAARLLGLESSPLGARLDALPGDLASRLRPALAQSLQRVPAAVRCTLGESRAQAFDALVHRGAHGELIVELEAAGPRIDIVDKVRDGISAISVTPTLRALADQLASTLKDLLGYDRVMVYRFDADGNGEVFSEEREAELESFLGNHYPASDIPRNARRLYERNRIRVLQDVEYESVMLEPAQSPASGAPLDMSLCGLRSMSPIHLQYLQNMGVRATLVASLMVGESLWGLIACHHYSPRSTQYELRAACELLAECAATRIAALTSFAQAQAELSVRRIEQHMIDAIRRDGDWRTALFDGSVAVLQPVNAAGAALLFEDQTVTAGEVPGTHDLRRIAAWLDDTRDDAVYVTTSLARAVPELAHLAPVASGLLAVAITGNPGDYLMWFRPEQVHTVTWGGDPNKAVVFGNDPSELSPRRSFAQWHQMVHQTSTDWSSGDVIAARLVGESVSDVIVQFHSLRMLIIEDQLERMADKVRSSEQPAVIADPQGRLLLVSDALQRLLGAGRPVLQWLDDLPPLFADSQALRTTLTQLMSDWMSWRGEVSLLSAGDQRVPLLLRADPVLAAPDRVLGFVLVFSDLTQRKAAESARRQFQRSVMEQRPAVEASSGSGIDPTHRELLVSVLENAQLAALEITDGVDMDRMPSMLRGVRTSMTRTSELLEHLYRYSAHDDDEPS